MPAENLPLSRDTDSGKPLLWSKASIMILSAIALLLLPAILLYQFNGDNDIYQAMGVVLYRYHGLPYLASWDHNFPGIVLLHALSIAWFGNSMLGFRFLEYLWQIAAVFVLYRVSRLWVSEAVGLLACLMFSLFYIQGNSAVMGQRDGFAILPLLLASGALIVAYRAPVLRRILLLAGGASYGFAAALRPTFALLLPVALITLFTLRSARGRKAWAYTLLGFGMIVLLFTLPYLMTSDGFAEAWNTAIQFNIDVYTPMAAHAALSGWFNRYPNFCYALLGSWLLSIALYRHKGWRLLDQPLSDREKWFLFFSYVALLFSILVMRSLLTYQFTPFYALFMPVPALLALDWKERLGRWGSIGFWTLLLVVSAVLYPWHMVAPFVRQGGSLRAAYSEENPDSTFGYAPTEAAAAYINQHTSAHDTVEVISMIAGLRWRVDRPEATPFTTAQALLFRQPDGTFTSYQNQWRTEFAERLANIRPKLLVFEDQTPFINGIEAIPGVTELLQKRYSFDTVIHRWLVYRRKE